MSSRSVIEGSNKKASKSIERHIDLKKTVIIPEDANENKPTNTEKILMVYKNEVKK